ncbi:MAG: hypothetical protein AABX37_05355 [Nanoarchaeota archaeon]
MEDQRRMVCDRCRSVVPLASMKYVPKGVEGKTALCAPCREETSKVPASTARKQSVQKQRYFCARCKYKFTFNEQGNSSLSCPYCSKDDKLLEHNPTTAESLLRSVGANRELF